MENLLRLETSLIRNADDIQNHLLIVVIFQLALFSLLPPVLKVPM